MWSPRTRLSTTFKFRHRVGTASISAALSTKFPRPSCYLDEPREPVRSCQTPRPPHWVFHPCVGPPILRLHCRHSVHSHTRNQVVCNHLFPVVFPPSVVQICITQAKSNSKNPKAKKRWSAKSLKESSIESRPQSRSEIQIQKKETRPGKQREAETLAGRSVVVCVHSVNQHGIAGCTHVSILVVFAVCCGRCCSFCQQSFRRRGYQVVVSCLRLLVTVWPLSALAV